MEDRDKCWRNARRCPTDAKEHTADCRRNTVLLRHKALSLPDSQVFRPANPTETKHMPERPWILNSQRPWASDDVHLHRWFGETAPASEMACIICLGAMLGRAHAVPILLLEHGAILY